MQAKVFSDMDYTVFPRELIYKEKDSLKDFGVNNEMTIEHRFYEGLLKRPSIKDCFQKRETILRIFNNAYYLCTLILMDEDPRLTIDYYREIAENTKRTIDWVNHFAPMTMALVYLKLKECRQECACELRIFDEFLLDDIYEHYRDWDTKGASEGKADFYELAGNSEQQYLKQPSDQPSFPPRTITIKSLGEAFRNNGYRPSLRDFTDDYDMERIAEIFRYLGRTKEEKESLRDALKWDIECFCDEERKHRFLAQLDGMDFSLEEHAVEQGMEARYSRALLEISIQEKKVYELKKEISQLKLKTQNAEDMLPSPSSSQNYKRKDDEDDENENLIAELRKEVNNLKNENKELRVWQNDYASWEEEANDYKSLWEQTKTTVHQKIVFFLSVFGISLDEDTKRFYNQSALAFFISCICNEKPSTIGPMISRIVHAKKRIRKNKAYENDIKLENTLATAAQSLSDRLGKIMMDSTSHDKTQKLNKLKDDLVLENPMSEDD